MTKPNAFHNLGPEAFPFTIEFLRADNGAVVHRIEVTGPGAVDVPPLAREHGVEIGVRIVKDGHRGVAWFRPEPRKRDRPPGDESSRGASPPAYP